jgi:phage protein D/phage baseplate assembly protein gpV
MSPTTTQLASRLYLKFNGTQASEQMTSAVISVEVDDSLTLPDMFTIHLGDPNLEWIDNDTFSLGTAVEIAVRVEGGQETTILTGEVTGIEPCLSSDAGNSVIIRGYDRSHRLNRDKVTKSFVQMTDSDIATAIANDAGLQTQVDSTSEVHDYVLQKNQTDWEFLIERAQRVGFRVMVKDDNLHFEEYPSAGSQTPTLEWAMDLLQFNARLTTARQVSEVVVQGWDPDNQQQIVGSATQPNDTPQIGESQQGGQAAQQAFGSQAREIIVDRPVSTQAEADLLAQAICDEIGQGFVEAECLCLGNPEIQAGVMVTLNGLGNRFSGSYRVTHALHHYDSEDGYETEFTVGGRHTATISELLSTMTDSGFKQGPVLGVVTNNDDPDDEGRVKVRIPSLKDSEESAWARVVAPGAGNNRGFLSLPEVSDEVLVVFENDDINRPLVLGGLWSQQNTIPTPPSECIESGTVKIRQMVTGTGVKIELDDNDNSILITNPDGQYSIKISENDSTIEIKSGGEVKIQSQQKTIIEAQGDVEINATGNLKMQGQQVEITANASAEIKANASLNLEASGITTVKGAMVQIN